VTAIEIAALCAFPEQLAQGMFADFIAVQFAVYLQSQTSTQ